MGKAPPWDTTAWRLPQELRPIYAAVKRVRELEATPAVSPAEIAAAMTKEAYLAFQRGLFRKQRYAHTGG